MYLYMLSLIQNILNVLSPLLKPFSLNSTIELAFYSLEKLLSKTVIKKQNKRRFSRNAVVTLVDRLSEKTS